MKFSIFSLKIHICSLKIRIFNLKIYICSLKIEIIPYLFRFFLQAFPIFIQACKSCHSCSFQI